MGMGEKIERTRAGNDAGRYCHYARGSDVTRAVGINSAGGQDANNANKTFVWLPLGALLRFVYV